MVDLCRFRVVCRRWNNLICSPEFGKLCLENAARHANEQACLVVNWKAEDLSCTGDLSCTHRRQASRWSILDLREKKWHDLKLDLPRYSRHLDMDGGIVCTTALLTWRALGRSSYMRNFKPESLVVFNPFGGAAKVLPDPGEQYFVGCMNLKLIVDNNRNTFKVLLIRDPCFGDRPMISIYESSANQWTTPPWPPFVPINDRVSSVIFKGLLYFCSLYCHYSDGRLWSFNFLDGSWEYTGMHFPHIEGPASHDLVMIDNRESKFSRESSRVWL